MQYQYLGYCTVCNCSNRNHLLNPMLQKSTHHLCYVSDPCTPSTSHSGFKFLHSPLKFSKFQISFSSIIVLHQIYLGIHGQTSMTAASIHQVPRHHHRQFMLVSLLFSENFRLSIFLFYQSQSWPSFSLQPPPPSRAEFVNTVSESLLPNSPFSIIISLFSFSFSFFVF